MKPSRVTRRSKCWIAVLTILLIFLCGNYLRHLWVRSYWRSQLHSADPEQRSRSLAWLGKNSGFRELNSILVALHDEDSDVRLQAVHSLKTLAYQRRLIKEYFPSNAAEVVPALAESMHDSNAKVREACAEVLGYYKFRPDVAFPALVSALDDTEPKVSKAAAKALASFTLDLDNKEAAARHIPRMIVKVLGEDKDVALSLASALGNLGPLAREAVPSLTVLLRDQRLRLVATDAIEQIGEGTNETVIALSDLLGDTDRGVAQSAANALAALRMKCRNAVPELIQRLKSTSAKARQASALALGRLRDESAIPALSEALNDQNVDVREAAAEALGRFR